MPFVVKLLSHGLAMWSVKFVIGPFPVAKYCTVHICICVNSIALEYQQQPAACWQVSTIICWR